MLASTASAKAPPPPPIRYNYADVADLAGRAPIVIDGVIQTASPVPKEQAVGVSPGRARMLITLNLTSLIRSPQGSPARITYVADVPLSAKGKPPKLKKNRVIIFAKPIVGRSDAVQLQSMDAQLAYSADTDAQVRSIIREFLRPDAPPAVAGITSAFYSTGNLPGEGESQIFLATSTDMPTSLVIARSGEGPPRWGVSIGELVDASATQPPRDTLGWYRLACFLPRTLPAAATEGQSAGDSAAIAVDYTLVIKALGACPRALTPVR